VRTISCSFQLLTHTSHPVTKPPRLHFNARKVGMPLSALTPAPARMKTRSAGKLRA
jgi:hypothetical protein